MSNVAAPPLPTIGVVGAGLLGTGIATQFARRGYPTRVMDTDPAAHARITSQVGSILDELAQWNALGADDRQNVEQHLSIHSDLKSMSACELVIEAVPENLELKRTLYAQLEPLLAKTAILASNTSGFPPEALARDLARPEQFLITHFWNAPHTVPLVEVVGCAQTKEDLIEQVMQWLTDIGNQPVRLGKAIAGFIGNRIQYAVLREALHIVNEGVATPQDVDQVVRATLGRRYPYAGPFEIADAGGLPTFLAVSEHLFPELADNSKLEQLLAQFKEKVDQGQTGQRSGQGFYAWSEASLRAFAQRRKETLAKGK